MDKRLKKILLAGGLFSLTLVANAESLPAFPGASGWGRFAKGGRGGSVYHVTNLNDSGTGSLRDAVSRSGRIVVFDVAGVINISSRMTFASNLYVAGQTAPGEGVTVYGNGVSFSGADNLICRYMKFRMGHNGDSGKDAAGVAHGTNMIFDHCSFSWGRDETFSINSDGKGDIGIITLQNCIFGQGLLTHSAGGLMQADSITLYRNFYCDNSTRNNKVKGINQYVNNLVYNWSNGAYIMGGDSEGTSYVNIESNLFINGPSKGGEAFTGANERFNVYGADNWQDKDMNGVFAPYQITNYSASTRVSQPYAYPALDKWPGNELIERLLPEVGASLPYRDPSDCYMIDEVMSFGTRGALISNEETLSCGAPSTWTLWQGNAVTDSDSDGMPDWWEEANGTDKNVDDAMTISSNGYANIENYINSITRATVDARQFFLRKPYSLSVLSTSQSEIVLSWADYTLGEDGFVVEMLKAGEWSEVARTAAGATTATIAEGLAPGTAYTLRVYAFKGEVKGDCSDQLTVKTKPLTADLVDCDAYQPDLTWGTSTLGLWNRTATPWTSATDSKATFTDGTKVLFAPERNVTVVLSDTLSPASVVVKSDSKVTLQGTGVIAGAASVNKAGKGILNITGTGHTYTGATVLHGGTLSVASLKNGGVASSIGAAQEFAQNLVLDGGTLLYTGSSTETNRSAQLLEESTLAVEKSSSTLTLKGSFEGDANLVIDGEGKVAVPDGAFFGYTGATILRGGTLYLSTVASAKAGIGSSSKVIMQGGTLKTKGESEGYETYSFPIEVAEGYTSQFSPNRNCYIANRVSGYGNLQINIPYLREYIQGNWSAFHGRIIANGVSSDNAGSLFLLNGPDLATVVVETKGNARICCWGTSGETNLGGVSGDAGTYLMGSSKNTSGFSRTWNVGGANTDETFRGIINNWACNGSTQGTVSINKVGTGLWRLTGKNVYSGATHVKGGRLVVNGQHTGTGAFTVESGATLAGMGSIAAAVTLQSGATLVPGDTIVGSSSLSLSSLTVDGGATLEFPLLQSAAELLTNSLSLSQSLTLKDGAILSLDMTDVGALKEGDSFTLFSGVPSVVDGRFSSISPATPGEGLEWELSHLFTDGRLLVVKQGASSLSSVTLDDDAQKPCYDLSGRRTRASKGIVISGGKKVMK